MEKQKKNGLRAWEVAALLSLSFTLCVGLWAQKKQEEISAQVVRLHILAADDSAEEQALKLRVRDAVLAYLEPELADAGSRAEAESRIAERLEQIALAAESAAEGRAITVSLGEEEYPARSYPGVRLPAGRYRSLRIMLGEGEGQNWWCVVFPPLCLSAAAREEARSVMAPEDYALITRDEGYELRFRAVELWSELVSWVTADH
ncbi:MAG: stage II sporulation protein R [Oscillospiraceae bacterium]|nr:stage II sporulation protein R [Oscillospiraceae bacterium]